MSSVPSTPSSTPKRSDGPPSRWPASHPERPQVVYDLDHWFHDLYDTALGATQMTERPIRRQRHYMIPQVVRRVRNVPGDAAEVGCFRGLSAYVACSTLAAIDRDSPFHIFDSFEGLSAPVGVDESRYLRAPGAGNGNPFACSEDQVRSNLAPFSNVRFYKGWVPDRFAAVADTAFSFVHVDVDLYEPTRDTVAFFWPRLSPGGAMVLDDYATVFYPGAREAVDEFFATRTDGFIVETPAGSAVAVKLGRS